MSRALSMIVAMLMPLGVKTTLYCQDTSRRVDLRSHRESSTYGIVWYPAVELSDTNHDAVIPDVAVSGDRFVHVTWWGWVDANTNDGCRIPYRRSVDDGKTWEPLRDIITDTVKYWSPFPDQIFANDGNNLYLFSSRELSGVNWTQGKLTMSKTTNHGITWQTTRVGPDSANWLGAADVHRDTMVVVYQPMQDGWAAGFARLVYSTNAGATWTRTADTLNG